jgi:hypothetical protein
MTSSLYDKMQDSQEGVISVITEVRVTQRDVWRTQQRCDDTRLLAWCPGWCSAGCSCALPAQIT